MSKQLLAVVGWPSDSCCFSTSYLSCCWHFLYLCSSFLAFGSVQPKLNISLLLFDQLVLSNLFCLFKNSHISAAVLMSTTLLLIFDSLLLLTHLIADVNVSPHHVFMWLRWVCHLFMYTLQHLLTFSSVLISSKILLLLWIRSHHNSSFSGPSLPQ